MSATSRPTADSRAGSCAVLRCPCGGFHLRVGPAMVHLSAALLHELAHLLGDASRRALADECRVRH